MSRARKKTHGRPQGGDPKPPRWQPMAKADPVPLTPEREAAMREAGADDALIEEVSNAEMWKNDQYTVQVARWPEGEFAGGVRELSIRRNDRRAARDWRDFQRIKTEIAGPEVEAIEIYPAESRLMDTANQYYLFCLPPGQQMPVGFGGARNVSTPEQAAAVGAVQRELPDDWEPNDPKDQIRRMETTS